MKLIELYHLMKEDGEKAKNPRQLLEQTHWLTVNADFDPKTGAALPQALSGFLGRVSRAKDGIRCDRLWRITEHARPSVERLFRTLHESPRREQAMLPAHAVRELDASSFMKLSNRPGRNIREKLAGKPYLQAVRRFQSVDLPENRLLKAFVIRLSDLLALRVKCLDEEDELLPQIQSWLVSDEAKSIGVWNNLPPNNTLLSHRDYRRVWDAWRWLQTLDEDIEKDFSQFKERRKMINSWKRDAKKYSESRYCFAEMPVLFDYEHFQVRPWMTIACQETQEKISRQIISIESKEPVCVDLSTVHPCYTTTAKRTDVLPDTYVWQQWKDAEKTVSIALFHSDAVYLHPEATSISSSDLFFSKSEAVEHLDQAARSFTSKLRDTFKHDKCIWLIPDFLNDFEIEIIRRNINARFPNAEPLPRSVAAVFARIGYSAIKRDGFSVIVIDTIGGKTCVTKLIARMDPELKKRLPETFGFYWERCPSVITSRKDEEKPNQKEWHKEIVTVDENVHWHDKSQTGNTKNIDLQHLKHNPKIGPFDETINLTESPATGGIRLHDLQKRVGDIPLWRDKIPELSIKVMIDGRYRRFYLVKRGTTVEPVRGLSIPLPVSEHFALPASRSFYQFPLFQGENAEEVGFSARLDSPVFPLQRDTVCELTLTFAYGADEPYRLKFTPLDKSFPPVYATWRRTEEVIMTNAPAPAYPTPMTWDELRSWRDPQGNEVDLLGWLLDSLDRLCDLIPNRCTATVSDRWREKTDDRGDLYWFTFVKTEDGDKLYCNTKHFTEIFQGAPNEYFPRGTTLYCHTTKKSGALSIAQISLNEEADFSIRTQKRIQSFKERSLQNRMSLIWSDARSLTDSECPDFFKTAFEERISSLLEKLPPQILAEKMRSLLACLHKDTKPYCIKWISKQVNSTKIHAPKSVGFALSDVAEDWQKDAFSKLLSMEDNSALSAFAYAIWREQHFVEKFSLDDLQMILKKLSRRLGNINSVQTKSIAEKSGESAEWLRATTETLELLLGLLRTRASKDPEIKMLLQPHQPITKELAKQVERVTEILADSKLSLFSRVKLEQLSKPDGDRTPDLLYALRLYLTGDDGANAIRVASVSDNDNDNDDE